LPSKAVLDTDILSEVFKGRDLNVLRNATAYVQQFGHLSFTSLTAAEFLFGLYAKDAKNQIDRAKTFLVANEELVPTSEDYWLYAEVGGALRRAGTPIGPFDAMIAACAINRKLRLVTGNRKHYEFVSAAGFSLDLEDWRAS